MSEWLTLLHTGCCFCELVNKTSDRRVGLLKSRIFRLIKPVYIYNAWYTNVSALEMRQQKSISQYRLTSIFTVAKFKDLMYNSVTYIVCIVCKACIRVTKSKLLIYYVCTFIMSNVTAIQSVWTIKEIEVYCAYQMIFKDLGEKFIKVFNTCFPI